MFEQPHDVRDSASVAKLIELAYLCACIYSRYNVVSTSDWNNAISRYH